MSWTTRATPLIVVGIFGSSLYALLAGDPYRNLPETTVIAAKAQDVCSMVVAVALLLLARSTDPKVHLVRLGLLAYVAYSYAIYLTGVPMNRIFLVYAVLVSLSGAALIDGLVRLRPGGWPRVRDRRLERATGWMLVTVAALFAGLWLGVLAPYAAGGAPPSPAGPGGAPYPVFVLDLVVVLPCVAVVGVLLLRGRAIAGPLAAVTLVKIVTLFLALWMGVVVGVLEGVDVHLGADAGPSLVMLLASVALLVLWLKNLSPDGSHFLRSTFWEPPTDDVIHPDKETHMSTSDRPTALVVHESMFDNTAVIAEAVAQGLTLGGLDVTSVDVAEAPDLDTVEVDLLVVGAPTHAFSLSRPGTRADAVRQGAPAERAQIGVREWLDGAALGGDRVRLAAMFDTRIRKVRHLPKAAGTRGNHVLQRLGFTPVVGPEAFVVDDVKGPLAGGEVERAVEWGRDLAGTCREHVVLAEGRAHS